MTGGTSAAEQVWAALGAQADELGGLTIDGTDPFLPSIFPVGGAAAAVIGTTAMAVAHFGAERQGQRAPGQPHVVVNVAEACASFRSERLLRVDGKPWNDAWAPLSGDYAVADGWVRLHANFPHHAAAAREALGCLPDDREAMATALTGWRALDVEEAVMAAGGCAAAMRSRAS